MTAAAAREILLDSYRRVHDQTAALIDGLTLEASTYRPDDQANTVAWLLWHLSRVQDDHVADLAGVPQAWEGWRERFGLPFDASATGYGQDADEVAAVRVDPELLAGYHRDVHELTVRYVEQLDDAELARVVDTAWDPPVTVSVRLVSVVNDAVQHLGQAAYVRGLAERRAPRTEPVDQTPAQHRFYGDLASWWPLISAPDEYAEEAAFAASLLQQAEPATRTVLELGSGGGNNAFHLKSRFEMTLVDLSEDMLAVSRALNPDCEHLVGDMRTVRLGRQFDAVFVHDAIEYMTTEADLRLAVATAYEHCRPGGVAVLVPDHIAENWEPSTDHGGQDSRDGRSVRYLSWDTDPDPGDTTTGTEYAFLLRAPDGSVQVAHDSHRLGLFGRETWIRVLEQAGFTARSVAEVTTDHRLPREFFLGTRQA